MGNNLSDTIKKYLKQGYSENQIKQALREKGLDEESIDKMIKEVVPPEVKKNKKTIFLIAGIVILIIIASGFYIIKPKTPQDYYSRGLKSLKDGSLDRAMYYANRAIELDPNYQDGYLLLGAIYFEKKEYDKALESYEKCRELNPNISNLHRGIAWIYLFRGEYGPALQEFKRALDLNPTRAETRNSIYTGIGRIYIEYLEPNSKK